LFDCRCSASGAAVGAATVAAATIGADRSPFVSAVFALIRFFGEHGHHANFRTAFGRAAATLPREANWRDADWLALAAKARTLFFLFLDFDLAGVAAALGALHVAASIVCEYGGSGDRQHQRHGEVLVNRFHENYLKEYLFESVMNLVSDLRRFAARSV